MKTSTKRPVNGLHARLEPNAQQDKDAETHLEFWFAYCRATGKKSRRSI